MGKDSEEPGRALSADDCAAAKAQVMRLVASGLAFNRAPEWSIDPLPYFDNRSACPSVTVHFGGSQDPTADRHDGQEG